MEHFKTDNNMNIKNNKWLGRVLAISVVALGMTACSDDHFEIDPEVAGRATLWENIQSNPELSEFADILANATYSKNENNATVQTYADLFNTEQTFTVWAPKNGSFDYNYYKELLNDKTQAGNYKVEKELIRNNMTRFTHLLNGNDSTLLDLFNSKTAWFDCSKGTFGNKKIVKSNIGATNGVLHITEAPVTYMMNLYEFIKEEEGLDSLREFFKDYEVVQFNEGASTQGPTVNGYITWVDSATYTYNRYFGNMGAELNVEDSCYAVIMPNNKAWDEMLQKTKKYYNYMNKYEQKIQSVDTEGNTTSETFTTVYTDEELDSIKNLHSKDAICRNLAFNVNLQWQHPYTDFTIEGACDSLMTTSRKIFKDPHSVELFDGAEPVELSNGYAYVVNNLNFKPSDTWAYDKSYKAGMGSVESYSKCVVSNTSIVDEIALEDYIYNEDGTVDTLSVDTTIKISVARTVQTSASANPELTFKLPGTLSCKYDIYLLMAYNYEADKPNQFNATITYHDGSKATTKSEKLKVVDDVHGSGTNFMNLPPHFDEDGKYQYIDSVLIAQDFEFPVCYDGVPNAYATLKIASYVSSKQTSTFCREMWIDKIVLKAKEETEE